MWTIKNYNYLGEEFFLWIKKEESVYFDKYIIYNRTGIIYTLYDLEEAKEYAKKILQYATTQLLFKNFKLNLYEEKFNE